MPAAKKPPQWKADDELTTMAAIRYLNVAKTSFLRYVKDGKITCVNPGERKARYNIAQLDNLRVVMATHKPQGGRPTAAAKQADAALDQHLTALIKTGSVGLLQDLLNGDEVPDDHAEALLRKVFTKLAIENKLVEEQIALCMHPRPDTKQKALEIVFSRILPTLKSQTVVKKTDAATQRFQDTLATKMDALRIEMQKARLFPGPIYEADIVESRDPVDPQLLVSS